MVYTNRCPNTPNWNYENISVNGLYRNKVKKKKRITMIWSGLIFLYTLWGSYHSVEKGSLTKILENVMFVAL